MTEGSSSHLQQYSNEHQLSLKLKVPAANDDRPVYVSGNFNQWRTRDEAYRLKQTGPSEYSFYFPKHEILPHQMEYKYHRGGWDQVEVDRYGNAVNNRKRRWNGQRTIIDHVERWLVDGKAYRPGYLPKIEVLTEDFDIPDLIKTRRIAALLPHDYDRTDKHYPVLYLQDGQNLFDEHAPFGNWGVDKRLALMAEQGFGDIIIVAIDHAEEDRISEFTPSYHTQLGSGDGKKYVRFLADRLKPYVDEHFRTLPGQEHTGIGGSSMGGLISIYAGLMYPEEYGKLMIFSPALWVAPNIHFHSMDLYAPHDMRVYVYAGEGESENMVPNIRRFMNAFENNNEATFTFELSLDPEGAHNEGRWGQEFPRAIEWLFFHQNDV
jgi:predicted alpha/beta superfamily hydrolase